MLHFLKLLLFHEGLLLQLSQDGITNSCTELDGRQAVVIELRARAGTGDEQNVGH